jgi:ribose 5-phosphate isomerase B
VAAETVERGAAICGSGVGGASIWRQQGSTYSCRTDPRPLFGRQGVEDDHMNIFCIGDPTVGPGVVWDLVQTFLAAEFSQARRHQRRLSKVAFLEL